MQAETLKTLRKEFSKELSKTAKITIQDGWVDILTEVLDAIRNHNESAERKAKLIGCVECNGGMRITLTNTTSELKLLIREAESKSYKTCELTGNPGQIFEAGGHRKTLDPELAKSLGFVPLVS